jgi:septin family protein
MKGTAYYLINASPILQAECCFSEVTRRIILEPFRQCRLSAGTEKYFPEESRMATISKQEIIQKMEELKEELEESKSHIYKFEFNEEEFKEQMEKLEKDLKENLPKLKKFKFEFDIEEEDSEV